MILNRLNDSTLSWIKQSLFKTCFDVAFAQSTSPILFPIDILLTLLKKKHIFIQILTQVANSETDLSRLKCVPQALTRFTNYSSRFWKHYSHQLMRQAENAYQTKQLMSWPLVVLKSAPENACCYPSWPWVVLKSAPENACCYPAIECGYKDGPTLSGQVGREKGGNTAPCGAATSSISEKQTYSYM